MKPGAILGRPFGAARMGAQCRRIGDCPSTSPCRGSPPWLPIRFERGHGVAPGRRLEHVPVLVRCGTGAPAGHLSLSFSVVRQRGLHGHSASPGHQPANPRHAYIGFRQGQEKTGFAPRANRVPQGRKRIAPGFNPGIHVAPRSSPVGTTESASGPRCIWVHIRSRAV